MKKLSVAGVVYWEVGRDASVRAEPEVFNKFLQ